MDSSTGPGSVRSAVVTSQGRRDDPVMACWQRNWQLTQPPADARRRRVDINDANTSTAAMAAPPVATVAATTKAAVSRK
jgi:hypothetical protein